ncbi:38509_t:CDS:2, partial [Gigaspora margarita]
ENEALKVIVKVAKMDHINKIFKSKNVKVLDKEYHIEEAPNDELFKSSKKNFNSSTICHNNIGEIQTQETNPKEEPLEPKLELSSAKLGNTDKTYQVEYYELENNTKRK